MSGRERSRATISVKRAALTSMVRGAGGIGPARASMPGRRMGARNIVGRPVAGARALRRGYSKSRASEDVADREATMADSATILIPDISGYTEFLTQTELVHSSHIVNELFEAILAPNEGEFELSEV